MGLEEYPSQTIANASEVQLDQMLKKFKSQQVSIAKLGGFLLYNFIALSGLLGFTAWFIKSRRVRKGQPRILNPSQLTLWNIVKQGSKIGVLLGGIYITGFVIVGKYTMPIPVFRKYCEIQQALHMFQVRYDPFYQEVLLFRKMKKFGLSDSLISQVKSDLHSQKLQLITKNRLKPETLQALKKADEIFDQAWKKE